MHTPRFSPGSAGKVESAIEAFATVRLQLESRPECITLVRSVLAGLAEFLELDPELSDDLKTAISEACNNVVLHAYPDAPGPLSVSLAASEDGFEVSVRDQGTGINRVAGGEDRMGVGLAVISALANRAEFESAAGEGTEVRMSFAGRALRAPAPSPGPVVELGSALALSGDVVVSLAPPQLLPEVMGRLVRAVAAGAHFSVDRFPSLQQLTSAIGARAIDGAHGGEVGFSITGWPKRLELSAGPIPAGSSAELFGGPVPPGLEPLLGPIHGSRLNGNEIMHVEVVEPRN